MADDHPSARAAFWREPLLQFLVIGAALFIVYRAINGAGTDAPREIVVTQSRVAALQENFTRTWLRAPTPEELRGLIDDYVREEVFYREAIAMGLDRDDGVVRRRLRQKMEFISEDISELPAPSDGELAQFLDRHRDEFLEPSRVSFEQLYLSPDRRGAALRRDAERLLNALQSGRSGVAGDPTLLPSSMQGASPQDLTNVFGEPFAIAIDEAPLGQWSGPFESSYGLHLVRVTARTAGTVPSLEQIRPTVLTEWQSDQARRRGDELYRSLLAKYDVRVESGAAATP